MKTPESKLKAEVKAFLLTVPNCFFFLPVPTGYGERGIQDFIGCWEGRYFAIETKATGKETPWQERIRKRVLTAGGLAVVARTVEEVHALFRSA